MKEQQYWLSPAKLNLFLYITGRRTDGYHNLQTLFQFVDYCDTLCFQTRDDDQICLMTEFVGVKQEDNLIIKATQLLLRYINQHNLLLPPHYGVDITVDKKLPMGGGLGGGSSNAATTLLALNQLWNLSLTTQQLMAIGSQIGADVPIFIYGHSAFAQGIGDQLTPIDIVEKWYLVVKPNVDISTVDIFTHPQLKRDTVTRNLTELLQLPFKNDCEPTVRLLYPQIDRLINLLSNKAPTRLTGTGSCLYCECDSELHAQQLQQFLKMMTQKSENITSFIAKSCNDSPVFKH